MSMEGFGVGMKKAWQISSIFFLVLSILILIHSFEYSYNDKLGPGPGFFCVWMSIITSVLSIALFLQSSLSKDLFSDAEDLIPERAGILRIVLILVALIFLTVFLTILGFRISMLLFLALLPTALGARNWLMISLFALAGSFGIFHVFYYWLKLPLPVGVLGI